MPVAVRYLPASSLARPRVRSAPRWSSHPAETLSLPLGAYSRADRRGTFLLSKASRQQGTQSRRMGPCSNGIWIFSASCPRVSLSMLLTLGLMACTCRSSIPTSTKYQTVSSARLLPKRLQDSRSQLRRLSPRQTIPSARLFLEVWHRETLNRVSLIGHSRNTRA